MNYRSRNGQVIKMAFANMRFLFLESAWLGRCLLYFTIAVQRGNLQWVNECVFHFFNAVPEVTAPDAILRLSIPSLENVQ
jgi:hypothetical protein